MNSSVYGKFALTNLKNNRKTYLPYILTAILTVMMYYIMDALSENTSIGDRNMQLILRYAVTVIMIFAVIFLFYTNSFLIKRRKKEIGTYNILGMGKGHIAKMLFIENFLIGIVSIGAGLICGILFSKLMWLVLLKLMHYDINMHFAISWISLVRSLILFGIIFGMTLIYNLLQIKLANPVELLRGGNQGEKEPKTKVIMTVFGIVAIGTGYGIALVTEAPLEAIGNFFIAVVCVILGTYALFVAGSIALLKLLRKNKKFYYKTKHFTAVSGMLYRMKQNAVGLANICILSTMVLVMISTTVSLYVGMEDVLTYRYPKEFKVTDYHYGEEQEREQTLRTIIEEETEKAGVSIKEMMAYHYGAVAAFIEGNEFSLKEAGTAYGTEENVRALCMMSVKDYNEFEDKNITLREDEVLIYNPQKGEEKLSEDTIKIDGDTYHVVKELDTMKVEKKNNTGLVAGYYVIFSDETKIEEYLKQVNDKFLEEHPGQESVFYNSFIAAFDLDGKEKDCLKAMENMQNRISEEVPGVYCESRELNRESFYNLYGSLFFIGVYLGALFLMATVLIIYYKQISEGYDDRERYQIMQKVGMSKSEVRRSIRSQVLMVFFLPLIVAVIHIAVAFKVITKLLAVLNLVNVPLFFNCTVVTVAVFAVFYGIIFVMTTREYYKIVN